MLVDVTRNVVAVQFCCVYQVLQNILCVNGESVIAKMEEATRTVTNFVV